MAKVGDGAPEFTLPSVDGAQVSLSDLRGRPVLLIFLRHLGCLPCREHVLELCQHRDELERLGVETVLITFSSVSYGEVWLKEVCSVFRLLFDPERAVYARYGLRRSFLRSWSLRTMRRYVQLMLGGRRWRGIQGDSAQLGGDFVLDAQGKIRLAHPSRDPTDRPEVETLLASLRQLGAETGAQ